MSSGAIIALNGHEIPAYIVELAGGLRMRLDINDWERLRLYRGPRVPVRLPGRADASLIVSEVVEIPPVVWIVLVERMRRAS